MLTSKTHPVLSREELDDRRRILEKPDQFTAAEIAAAGLTDEVRGRKYDQESYKIDTAPVDPRTSSKRVDFRKVRPEVGD